jgi:cellulose synthase/poly-beta-1,6-N-acetylglucosamine synthase-like glycosyltransferase
MENRAMLSVGPTSLRGVCVVIPAFNEEKLIARCVTSVLDAGIDADQIYVINDCSRDGTREVLGRFRGIHVVDNPERLGKVRGLERAIDVHGLPERYEYMAVLDADSHLSADYFEVVVRAFARDPGAVLVCGSPRSEPANWITAFRALDYAIGDWVYREGQHALGVILVAPGCASTYRTSVIRSLDWNGGTLVEDMDLTIQIHRKRLGSIHYARAAVSHTQDPQCLADYTGQIMRWYSGTWQVMRLRRLLRGGQRIDLEFALLAGEGIGYSLLTLLLPVLAMFAPGMALRWLLFDQALMLIAAALCAVRLRRPDILLWSPTFIILRFVNCFVWVRSFWREVVRGHSLRVWFTPERYVHERSPARPPCQEAFHA